MLNLEKPALAYLYSIFPFFLIIVFTREAHFFQIITFQSLSKHRGLFKLFFQHKVIYFLSQIFQRNSDGFVKSCTIYTNGSKS